MAKAFSCFIALAVAFVASPIIAIITKGKYYIARDGSVAAASSTAQITCISCGYDYEAADMTNCPFHSGPICSLCCSLDSACHDSCRNSSGRGGGIGTRPTAGGGAAALPPPFRFIAMPHGLMVKAGIPLVIATDIFVDVTRDGKLDTRRNGSAASGIKAAPLRMAFRRPFSARTRLGRDECLIGQRFRKAMSARRHPACDLCHGQVAANMRAVAAARVFTEPSCRNRVR